MRWRSLRFAACVVGVAGACVGDSAPMRRAGYATVHDTMPEAVHRAMHQALERPAPDRTHGKGIHASDARLTRIADSNDAWLEFDLVRDSASEFGHVADTVALLMNCNADSLVMLDARGKAISRDVVIAPRGRVRFVRDGSTRVRVFGLRPTKAGMKSESLVRTVLGGDMVLLTAVADR